MVVVIVVMMWNWRWVEEKKRPFGRALFDNCGSVTLNKFQVLVLCLHCWGMIRFFLGQMMKENLPYFKNCNVPYTFYKCFKTTLKKELEYGSELQKVRHFFRLKDQSHTMVSLKNRVRHKMWVKIIEYIHQRVGIWREMPNKFNKRRSLKGTNQNFQETSSVVQTKMPNSENELHQNPSLWQFVSLCLFNPFFREQSGGRSMNNFRDKNWKDKFVSQRFERFYVSTHP